MNTLLRDKKVFLVGGSGGVGKTTVAASLGVRLALEGYRTVVLTVDPARRLAQALGFQEGFQSELQEVAIPGTSSGSLHATMLDTQRYFDRVIDRFASGPAQKEKILSNPIYRTMVDSLGGTHEYAAMERLLEFSADPRFEKIVVDTPPTQNAVDLLSAPQRLADFMDNSVVKWFRGPKPMYLSFFQQGTRLAIKLLRKLLGNDFFDRFESFMEDIGSMQAGFRARNLEVLDLLRSPTSAFLLVTYPSEARFQESVTFLKTLEENRISLATLILNRLETDPGSASLVSASLPEKTREELEGMLGYFRSLREEQQIWVSRFRQAMPQLPTFTVPRAEGEIHDVASLSHLTSFLVN